MDHEQPCSYWRECRECGRLEHRECTVDELIGEIKEPQEWVCDECLSCTPARSWRGNVE